MLRLGASYHPFHTLRGSKRLALPPGVSFVELGLYELEKWMRQDPVPDVALSLHLARTPVCEPERAQRAFVAHLLESSDRCRLASVGLHVTGPRDSGIGRLGFSSHFVPGERSERQARRFIGMLQDAFGLPVWIENANFYSPDPRETVAAWASIRALCDRTGARAIVDLSHAFIDASNTGLEPAVLLGAVPWDAVAEIHLSGVARSKDGALHDGHSQPVAEAVWTLFELCVASLLPRGSEVVATVEHSDHSWGERREEYFADFEKARELAARAAAKPAVARAADARDYAFGYLGKIVARRIPGLEEACRRKGAAVPELLRAWAEAEERAGRRIVLTLEEVPPSERDGVVLAAEGFLDFVKRRLS